MNAAQLPTLVPLLPEFVLGIGAMALLMFGAYGGEGKTRIIDVASIVLIVIAGVILVTLPPGKLDDLRRQLRRRRFRPLPENPGADRLGRRHRCCRSITPGASARSASNIRC